MSAEPWSVPLLKRRVQVLVPSFHRLREAIYDRRAAQVVQALCAIEDRDVCDVLSVFNYIGYDERLIDWRQGFDGCMRFVEVLREKGVQDLPRTDFDAFEVSLELIVQAANYPIDHQLPEIIVEATEQEELKVLQDIQALQISSEEKSRKPYNKGKKAMYCTDCNRRFYNPEKLRDHRCS